MLWKVREGKASFLLDLMRSKLRFLSKCFRVGLDFCSPGAVAAVLLNNNI